MSSHKCFSQFFSENAKFLKLRLNIHSHATFGESLHVTSPSCVSMFARPYVKYIFLCLHQPLREHNSTLKLLKKGLLLSKFSRVGKTRYKNILQMKVKDEDLNVLLA